MSISCPFRNNTHAQCVHSVDFQTFTHFLKFKKLYLINNQLVTDRKNLQNVSHPEKSLHFLVINPELRQIILIRLP